MTKHTPGPWEVVFERRRDDVSFQISTGLVSSSWAHVATVDRSVDALLIAAAPEMLAALQDLVKDAPFVGEEPGQEPDCGCGEFIDYVPVHDEPPTCRHTRARAAIAKATRG